MAIATTHLFFVVIRVTMHMHEFLKEIFLSHVSIHINEQIATLLYHFFPSICHVMVLYLNEYTYRQTFSTVR